jgi:hypothetical protein
LRALSSVSIFVFHKNRSARSLERDSGNESPHNRPNTTLQTPIVLAAGPTKALAIPLEEVIPPIWTSPLKTSKPSAETVADPKRSKYSLFDI